MSQNLFVDKFIFEEDKNDRETYLKGKFFVYSTLVFSLLCFASVPFIIVFKREEIEKHPDIFISNIIISIATLGLILYYKRYGRRVLLVNFLTFLGWTSTFPLYEASGIYAPDNIWGILISAWVFLVANKKSGIFWFIISALTLIFLYTADFMQLKDFKSFIDFDSRYYFYSFFLACIFLLLIIYLHEKSKDSFIEQIKGAKAELELRNRDVTDSINYAKKFNTQSYRTKKLFIEAFLFLSFSINLKIL